ncbi:MAG: nitrilase-related carbon-nitrogen hydrolase [SAR324 cluster bacterium]|nr:nitrilase-related carbon-nitrogen hydrolase [SAR324 cluster bacterium]
MKAAIIQFTPDFPTPLLNFNSLIALCEEAAASGAKLIQLPEMCLAPYLWDSTQEIATVAEPKQGASFVKLSTFAAKNDLYICYGYPEVEGSNYYNSQNLINPEGKLIGHYRKKHLYEADLSWATPGNLPFQSIQTPVGKIGLGICMDLNFNDFTHFHVLLETEILCLAVNWLDEGTDVTSYWAARLTPFTQDVLISNRFGPERHIKFCGRSSHFQGGELLAIGEKDQNQIIILETKNF